MKRSYLKRNWKINILTCFRLCSTVHYAPTNCHSHFEWALIIVLCIYPLGVKRYSETPLKPRCYCCILRIEYSVLQNRKKCLPKCFSFVEVMHLVTVFIVLVICEDSLCRNIESRYPIYTQTCMLCGPRTYRDGICTETRLCIMKLFCYTVLSPH